MFRFKHAAVAALAGSLLASGAHAATYTQFGTITGDAPDYTQAYADFAGFDSSLGTLDGAALQVVLSYSAHMVFQYAAMPAQGTDTVVTRVDAGFPGASLPVADIPTVVHFTPLFPTGGIAGDLSITTRIADPFPESSFAVLTAGSGFEEIVGASTRYDGMIPDAVSLYRFSVTASMVYDYTPFAAVPEPASLTLFGGLLATTLLTRRRQAVRAWVARSR